MPESQLSLIAILDPAIRLPDRRHKLTRRYSYSRMQYVELCRFSPGEEAEPFSHLKGLELDLYFVSEVWTSHFQILLAQFPVALRKTGLPEIELHLLLSWQEGRLTLEQEKNSAPVVRSRSLTEKLKTNCRIDFLELKNDPTSNGTESRTRPRTSPRAQFYDSPYQR